jgi:hypothetical protein
MGDLLNQLYKSYGFRAMLGMAVVVTTIWFIVHRMTPPCERISIFILA